MKPEFEIYFSANRETGRGPQFRTVLGAASDDDPVAFLASIRGFLVLGESRAELGAEEVAAPQNQVKGGQVTQNLGYVGFGIEKVISEVILS